MYKTQYFRTMTEAVTFLNAHSVVFVSLVFDTSSSKFTLLYKE
jgi:hypothetical protein